MSVLHLKYKRLKRQKRRNIILNIVCLLIAGSGLVWTANYFWRYINYEITNDAFVDQYIAPVNVRVAGYIQEVRFREHQFVHEGDTRRPRQPGIPDPPERSGSFPPRRTGIARRADFRHTDFSYPHRGTGCQPGRSQSQTLADRTGLPAL